MNAIKTKSKEKIVCECGNDSFNIYITSIIEDAVFFCSECEEIY